MVAERQRKEAEQLVLPDQENTLSQKEEPAFDQGAAEPEMQGSQSARAVTEDGAEIEPAEQQVPLPPKSTASSREKRATRRQRGLEHNELQNKHVAFALEGQVGALSREGSPPREEEDQGPKGEAAASEPPKGTAEEGLQVTDEPPVPLDNGTVDLSSPSRSQQEEVGVARVNSNGLGRPESHKSQIRVSQSFTCPERPSELALNLQNHLTTSKSFREPAALSGDRNKQRTQRELGSPTSFQIQRYQDDPEKLRDKRERWKGKRRLATGQSDVLSQSLEERSEQSPSPPQHLT